MVSSAFQRIDSTRWETNALCEVGIPEIVIIRWFLIVLSTNNNEKDIFEYYKNVQRTLLTVITNALLTFSDQWCFALYINLTLDGIIVLWIVLLGIMNTELSRLCQIVSGHLSIHWLFCAVHNLRGLPPLLVVQGWSYSMSIIREPKKTDPAELGRTTTSHFLLPFQLWFALFQRFEKFNASIYPWLLGQRF